MKHKYCFATFFLLYYVFPACGQQVADSVVRQPEKLAEVEITGYPSPQALVTTPASVSMIDSMLLRFRVQPALVSSFNMVPGVRMEERSPGSYRLSIRGSLLRSPYGVRNVKVYLDDFPLTDGGGNTYLNCIDLTNSSRIEIIKGPDGSLFGANTGGVVHLIPSGINEPVKPAISIGGGSYGMFHEDAEAGVQIGKHVLGIQESYYRSDGYRINSAMHKANIRLSDKWQYASRSSIKLFLSYSDLYYQTPGGLTLQQEEDNPRNARPATATLPSAVAQKAAVYTKLLFAGITHKVALNPHLDHVLSVYGSLVDFKNPFITNYEVRKENTEGFRTYLEWHDIKTTESNFHYTLHLGAEWTQSNADIHNYDNNGGLKGNLQAQDNITSPQYFFFTRLKTEFMQRWMVEAAVSLGYAGYHFKGQPPVDDRFHPQWMPKLATSYKLNNHVVIRALVSRGYSTPTTAEIRPSNNLLYTGLQPEYGWNYEAGIRLNMLQHRFMAEATVFHYRLQNAIVSHLDNSGNAFFTNAGGTRQTGLETNISYKVWKENNPQSVVSGLYFFNSTTWNAFYFRDYRIDDNDYSGNRLTGVPAIVNIFGISCDFIKGFNLSATYNHTGNLPLNDANTSFADPYNLLQASVGKGFRVHDTDIKLSIGVDNLLNETYSLGNDINAAGNRYYNPAAKRNFMAELKIRF
ncbi:TonB-dependent receptor plug domain-containing protein [Taibaiella lutea]|uniref:TonB-dependent receptor plug domain-containing protein n=1 Tax=Taibaiella lutea TaxID=2608001 RepID=A0A5M6CBA3_9BACT|nr:TonB-dependent receptor [Taibaiella lutea]KAA5532301.1 TonB-dependent receptor plug domain-containing protein [Taibaiella lutea]